MDSPGQIDLIRNVLKENPRGLTIGDIAHIIGLNRNSTARYLDILETSGHVELITVGPAKVYVLSQRIPLHSLLEHSSQGIIMLDHRLRILRVNKSVITMLDKPTTDLLGLTIAEVIPNTDLQPILQKALRQEESSLEITIPTKTEPNYFAIKVLPAAYDNGEHGIVIFLEDITQRKQTRLALRASEELYRTLIETSPDAIFLSDTTLNITFANKRAAEMLGAKDPENLIGHSSFDLIPSFELERAKEYIQKVVSGEQVHHIKFTLKRFDGTLIFVEMAGALVKNSQGEPIALLGIARDISAKQAQETSLTFLASIVNSSEDAIYTRTKDGIITSWNKAAEKTFGYSAEEVIGKPIDILVPKDKKEELTTLVEKVLRNQPVKNFETTRIKKNQSFIPISLTLSPILDQDHNLLGISAIARDTSEKKQYDYYVQRLVSLVNYSDDAIISKTNEGIITHWNTAAELLYGYSAEEMVGKSIIVLVPQTKKEEFLLIMDDVKKGQGIKNYVTKRKKKDGTIIDVVMTISPIRNEKGAVIGASSITRDLQYVNAPEGKKT